MDLGDEVSNLAAELPCADVRNDVAEAKTAAGNLAPVSAGEDAQPVEIFGIELDFPPLRIWRQLAPHVTATAEQQGPAKHVVFVVSNVRVEHQVLKFLAVAMEFLLVELVLEEFGDHLGFRNS